MRVDNHPVTLVQAVREAGRGAPVAIEATYAWYWAVNVLLAAGCDVHLAHPYGMCALRKRKRVKSDPADAYELANLVRLGSLPESYIAPPQLRELRELVRHRRQLVKLSTSMKAGVRALLAKHNIRLAASDLDSDRVVDLLDRLRLAGTYRDRLASQRRVLLVLADEVASVEVELDRRLKHHPGYRRLLTVKSIGPTLAAVLVVEIGDVSRFPSAAALCCWAGLTPRLYSSDTKTHRGHVSKEGSALVRWAAVEAVQRHCEPAIAAVRADILTRRGREARNIAKVAAARRLLEAVYYLLRDGEARCLQVTAA